MIITKLVYQKTQRRVNLELDGKFAFGLATTLALKKHLKVGQKLSQEKAEQLLLSSLSEELYQAVLNYLSIRPHSEKEIQNYLEQRLRKYLHKKFGIDIDKSRIAEQKPTLINKIISRLKHNGFVDDLEFARWFINQRIRFRPRGKKVLKIELRQKGVKPEVIEQVLFDDSLYPIEVEKKAIKQLAEKAFRQLKGLKTGVIGKEENFKMRRRLFQRLLARGFSYEMVKKAVDEILNKE